MTTPPIIIGDWENLTAQKITNLFLYGSETTPESYEERPRSAAEYIDSAYAGTSNVVRDGTADADFLAGAGGNDTLSGNDGQDGRIIYMYANDNQMEYLSGRWQASVKGR